MKVLLIGGTGNISWWCADEALRHGCEVTILNRAETVRTRRKAQDGVRRIRMDINDLGSLEAFLSGEKFDVVADFIAYSADVFRQRWNVLETSCEKLAFVSSTLIFERDATTGHLNEESPKRPYGINDYIDGKLGIEDFLEGDLRTLERTVIMRPAHTFDTNVPTPLGSNCFTDVQRLLEGQPLLVPGDGTGKWTILHSSDFARAWMQLIQTDAALGNSVNIVGDHQMSWNEIASQILDVLNLPNGHILPVPVEEIESVKISDRQTANSSNLGANFKLHRKWDDLYDTAKLRELVPGWRCETSFARGFAETAQWLQEDPARIRISPHLRSALDDLAGAARSAAQ